MRTYQYYKDTINAPYLASENLLQAIEPFLPDEVSKGKGTRGGRPRKRNWEMFIAMYYVMITGMQWKALPKNIGASSTVHDRFKEWVKAGVFARLWQAGLSQAAVEGVLDLEWATIDACLTKAPLGGELAGRNPTDRGKQGTKRTLAADANGLPVGVTLTSANRHDSTQFEAVLEQLSQSVPSDPQVPLKVAADKAYDDQTARKQLVERNMEAHIPYRDKPSKKTDKPKKRKATKDKQAAAKSSCLHQSTPRWTNERTHSWMNKWRHILVRWDKKAEHYLAWLHLACAVIVWRKCNAWHSWEVFG